MTVLKFSVVIPTYNRSGALKRCLDSLVNQSYKNFEVIVCDDGSTDDTKYVVESYKDKLSLTYDYAENWGGPAKPRNRGIELAKGEWVCFLDSDDWWDDNKLEVISMHSDSNVSVFYHPLKIISAYAEPQIIKCRVVNNKDAKVDLLINLNTLPTSSVCVKKDLLNKMSGFSLRKDIIGLEDYDFWIQLAGEGAVFQRINNCLGYYFNGDSDNITHEDERQIQRFEKLYSPYYSLPSLNKVKSKIRASYHFHHGRILQDAKLSGSYRKHLLLAFLGGSGRVRLMALKRLIKF